MDLPSFYEFFVGNNFVNFFNKKLDDYKKEEKFFIQKNSSATMNGIQTRNILQFSEKEVLSELNWLKSKLQRKCKTKFEYHWAHIIEYEYGGYQLPHTHDHNEDFSVVLYLNTCKTGETIFTLNEKRNVIKKVFPEKKKAIMFHSSISHRANSSLENKRVLVFGLKLV